MNWIHLERRFFPRSYFCFFFSLTWRRCLRAIAGNVCCERILKCQGYLCKGSLQSLGSFYCRLGETHLSLPIYDSKINSSLWFISIAQLLGWHHFGEQAFRDGFSQMESSMNPRTSGYLYTIIKQCFSVILLLFAALNIIILIIIYDSAW